MPRVIALILASVFLALPRTATAQAQAQDLIGSYQAYLSARDHFNSSGVRLRSAAAIIRQDRANFHKFGRRDGADEGDDFFASKANRARMEQMLENGSSPAHVIDRVVNGTPLIRVTIYGRGSRGTHIIVEVR